MSNITVRAPDELSEALNAEADARGLSQAEYVRRILRARHDSDERVDALEADLDECRSHVDDLERELERVRREKRQILDQRDEHSELVRAVGEQRTLEQRRAEAGVVTRFRWWLRGMDGEE